MSVSLGDIMIKLIQKNLTKEELKVAESICADFVKSNPIHEWCYRVWVKSYYEGEDADRVVENFGMYERVFTSRNDVGEYMEKVEADLRENGYHPFESSDKFYDCAVLDSTILFNHKEVRLWK